jgi:hypothetical protein
MDDRRQSISPPAPARPLPLPLALGWMRHLSPV